MEKEIKDFIARRFPVDCDWLTGNCYYFALILSNRFSLDIYYLPVEGHFVVGDGKNYYDWRGCVNSLIEEKPMTLNDIYYEDPAHYIRIMRDCCE